jgi:hypothetical protein
MTEEILYCANGCTRASGDERYPVQTQPPALICDDCEDRLRTWLREIPDLYAQLPLFWLPGSTEPDPDKRATTRTDAPTPLRLVVTDLTDQRRGRIWQGTEPTIDRRGTLGVLNVQARHMREDRTMIPVNHPTVAGESHQLAVNVAWLIQQTWISYDHDTDTPGLYDEIKRLHRDMSNTIGEYAPRPVANCTHETDEGACGGPLLPARLGGVFCPRCHDKWPITELARLGLLLGQDHPA